MPSLVKTTFNIILCTIKVIKHCLDNVCVILLKYQIFKCLSVIWVWVYLIKLLIDYNVLRKTDNNNWYMYIQGLLADWKEKKSILLGQLKVS